MGYTTRFQGEIKITPELKAGEINFIKKHFGDMRDWNPAEAEARDWTHFDFEFNEAMDGIRHDGSEKTYDFDETLQYLIEETVKEFPHIEFNGVIEAQGEKFDDRWTCKVKKNKVSRKTKKLDGEIIECPCCEEKFELKDEYYV